MGTPNVKATPNNSFFFCYMVLPCLAWTLSNVLETIPRLHIMFNHSKFWSSQQEMNKMSCTSFFAFCLVISFPVDLHLIPAPCTTFSSSGAWGAAPVVRCMAWIILHILHLPISSNDIFDAGSSISGWKTLSFAKKATNFQFWMEIDLQKTPSSRPSWPKIFLGRSVCWSSSSWKVPTPETSGWCRTTPFCDQQKRRRLEIQEVKNGGSSGFFFRFTTFWCFFFGLQWYDIPL